LPSLSDCVKHRLVHPIVDQKAEIGTAESANRNAE
jgi:hypothetical protein